MCLPRLPNAHAWGPLALPRSQHDSKTITNTTKHNNQRTTSNTTRDNIKRHKQAFPATVSASQSLGLSTAPLSFYYVGVRMVRSYLAHTKKFQLFSEPDLPRQRSIVRNFPPPYFGSRLHCVHTDPLAAASLLTAMPTETVTVHPSGLSLVTSAQAWCLREGGLACIEF